MSDHEHWGINQFEVIPPTDHGERYEAEGRSPRSRKNRPIGPSSITSTMPLKPPTKRIDNPVEAFVSQNRLTSTAASGT
ncbi:MAG: hypothetical protein AB7V18_00635 [Pyrinomonadaceae bacterium]